MKRPNLKLISLQVENWNLKHPVGTAVTVRTDSGAVIATKTKSPAQILSGHSAVIWLEGISGCHALDRVVAMTHLK
jgi:hypothetical protein